MNLVIFIKEYQTLIVGIFTLVVLIVGLRYTYLQIKSMRKTRDSELLLNAFLIWGSKDVVESGTAIRNIVNEKQNLCEMIEKYGKEEPAKYFSLLKIADLYEHLGLMVKKESIDLDLVDDLFGSSILNYYSLYEEWIKKEREDGQPTLYEHFEDLRDMIKNKRAVA